MSSATFDFALAIGGAAGQGIATPGDILARMFVRRGLHLCAYNAHQSIIRGGYIFLTLRVSEHKIHNHGDELDLLVCLHQDTIGAGRQANDVSELMTDLTGDAECLLE